MFIKNKYLLLFCFLSFQLNIADAQKVSKINDIKIGDKIPDIEVSQLIGSTRKTVKISQLYKRGLLIIDFWATWCTPCLREMPTADSLVAKYSKLSVLSISHDDLLKTTNFLKIHSEIPHSHLIVSSDDKLLSQYFKHVGIPHNVWIDSTGTVRLISQGYAVTDKYVNQFLHGIVPHVRIKKAVSDFKFWKPYHVPDSLLEYRSIFTHYNDTLLGGELYNGAIGPGKSKRVFVYNQSITTLYWIAFTNQLSSEINWNAVELHTNDSLKFYHPAESNQLFTSSKYFSADTPFEEQDENWNYDNCYCYDLSLPAEVLDSLFSRYMFEDLNRFFNITGKVEKRMVSVAVLKRNANLDTTKIQRFIPKIGYVYKAGRAIIRNGYEININDRTLDQVIAWLITNLEFDPKMFPVINETGIDYPLSMKLELPRTETSSSDMLIALLKSYGLSLTMEMREAPVLIIYDHNH